MSDLTGCGPTLTMQAAVRDESAADTCADGQEKDALPPLPCSVEGFGQCGRITVVAQKCRDAQFFLSPFGQVKILPARDLMALDHASLRGVNGTAETEPGAKKGMEETAIEFVKKGAEIYHRA